MKKNSKKYECIECGHQQSQWVGRCPSCELWNTYHQKEVYSPTERKSPDHLFNSNKIKKINEIQSQSNLKTETGIDEFDKVVGGGLIKGSITLIAGSPGIGKSTLILMLAQAVSCKRKTLYISGEETLEQVADRARRLDWSCDNLVIQQTNYWEEARAAIEHEKGELVVIDSIQTIYSNESRTVLGGSGQIKDTINEMVQYFKDRGVTVIIIGQVTKEGLLAGPKMLEHMVDTYLHFESDNEGLRVLRSVKNRFASTNEVGFFMMSSTGLKCLEQSDNIITKVSAINTYGNASALCFEGKKPMLIGVEALVIVNKNGATRKSATGMDSNRFLLLCTIAEKYFEIPLSSCDVYLNVVGGLKLENRQTDLAVLASLFSSYRKVIIPKNYVFWGEVGLTGEVRSPARPGTIGNISNRGGLKGLKFIIPNQMEEEFCESIDFVSLSKVENVLDHITV